MTSQNQSFDRLCRSGVELSAYSTYEIGGAARHLALPRSIEEMAVMLEGAKTKGLNPFLFGMGSNTLFPDRPDDEMLFFSLKEHIEFKLLPGRLFVSAGTPMTLLALFGLYTGIGAFDFTFLLPGTLGAGVYMNAKYFSHQISDVLETAYVIDKEHPERGILSVPLSQCEYGYKTSIFMRRPWIVVGADLKLPVDPKLTPEETEELFARLKAKNLPTSVLPDYFRHYAGELNAAAKQGFEVRQELLDVITDRGGKYHFDYPSCGSVFKNNYTIGEPMGKLVDRLGLRGTVRGGAMISDHHGNIIQNRGGAKASDVTDLVQLVQEKVEAEFGFLPEPELIIV
ncbi:UDP-N-acetylmuramate dehydrogenase [Saccharibacillus alkalitolerans]|uniref:UDP-N-acetylenolpyruvoylglucosamine reductase n=1 Tax=Saccharibacillus alkalitolerans TaxID=2705290 RepID=A0ABX0F9X1_9BACL|nr:UDP-N-acetylenolpyruvoylglucosamine reductase [Saccharibacillus alkalitolerans]NGZ77731.1 UDP-N-acetylenolpyruvoylglucosamine reductase [Saccharibacillus alkalitolerans]